MATIDIRRAHSLEPDLAKQRAEELAQDLQQKLGITWAWEGTAIAFSAKSGVAKGVTGKVSVGATEVRVEIDLPFLMRAMKGSLVGKVNERLDHLTRPA